MGAAASVRRYRNFLRGNSPISQKLAWFAAVTEIELEEASSLFALYERVDESKDGSVSWAEFAEVLYLEDQQPYLMRLFQSLNSGDDGNDDLDCLEFLAGVYGWCTMTPSELIGQLYRLYAGEAGMEMDDLKRMLKEIHFRQGPEKIATHLLIEYATDIVQSLREKRAEIPYTEESFVSSLANGRPEELDSIGPVLDFQSSVRINTFGNLWWQKQTDRLHMILLQRGLPSLSGLLEAGLRDGNVDENAWILRKSRPQEDEEEGGEEEGGGGEGFQIEGILTKTDAPGVHVPAVGSEQDSISSNTHSASSNLLKWALRRNGKATTTVSNPNDFLCVDSAKPTPQEEEVIRLLTSARSGFNRAKLAYISSKKGRREYFDDLSLIPQAGHSKDSDAANQRWDSRQSSVIRRRSSIQQRRSMIVVVSDQ